MKIITLSKGYFTKVDNDTFNKYSVFKWSVSLDKIGSARAIREVNHKRIYLHREILNAVRGKDVDHINGDTLDNRRSNLRVCSRAENIRNGRQIRRNNTSGYKGVSFHKASSKWVAYIGKDYTRFNLGLFPTKLLAALAYNQAAIKLHGEFARLNTI